MTLTNNKAKYLVIQLDGLLHDLPEPVPGEDFVEMDLDDDRGIWQMWAMVLKTAIRDEASSIHFHPWKKDRSLSAVINGSVYEMIPPDIGAAKRIFGVWSSRLIRKFTGQLISALRGTRGPSSIAKTLCMQLEGSKYFWTIVCWSTDERYGVDLFRHFNED